MFSFFSPFLLKIFTFLVHKFDGEMLKILTEANFFQHFHIKFMNKKSFFACLKSGFKIFFKLTRKGAFFFLKRVSQSLQANLGSENDVTELAELDQHPLFV